MIYTATGTHYDYAKSRDSGPEAVALMRRVLPADWMAQIDRECAPSKIAALADRFEALIRAEVPDFDELRRENIRAGIARSKALNATVTARLFPFVFVATAWSLGLEPPASVERIADPMTGAEISEALEFLAHVLKPEPHAALVAHFEDLGNATVTSNATVTACAQCGTPFEVAKRYCSTRCRVAAHRAGVDRG
jgi:hypothetical protein